MLIDSSVSRLPPFLTRQRRAEQRLHDRPCHRCGAGQREQEPGPPGQRRQPAHQRQPGRPCQMATFAARRLQPMIANVAHILGIEWLAAAQGIEFLRPLRSAPALEQAHALLRAQCPSDECRPLPGARHRARHSPGARRRAVARVANPTGPTCPHCGSRPEPAACLDLAGFTRRSLPPLRSSLMQSNTPGARAPRWPWPALCSHCRFTPRKPRSSSACRAGPALRR
jgi:hypothetical protein